MYCNSGPSIAWKLNSQDLLKKRPRKILLICSIVSYHLDSIILQQVKKVRTQSTEMQRYFRAIDWKINLQDLLAFNYKEVEKKLASFLPPHSIILPAAGKAD